MKPKHKRYKSYQRYLAAKVRCREISIRIEQTPRTVAFKFSGRKSYRNIAWSELKFKYYVEVPSNRANHFIYTWLEKHGTPLLVECGYYEKVTRIYGYVEDDLLMHFMADADFIINDPKHQAKWLLEGDPWYLAVTMCPIIDIISGDIWTLTI